METAAISNIDSGKLPAAIWDLPRPKDNSGLALDALLKERDEAR
jgi:hypothetical protein